MMLVALVCGPSVCSWVFVTRVTFAYLVVPPQVQPLSIPSYRRRSKQAHQKQIYLVIYCHTYANT